MALVPPRDQLDERPSDEPALDDEPFLLDAADDPDGLVRATWFIGPYMITGRNVRIERFGEGAYWGAYLNQWGEVEVQHP